MAYEFQNTNTARDAVFMAKNALARLQQYDAQADAIVNASAHAAAPIAAIKDRGIHLMQGFFPRDEILALGEQLEQKILAALPGMTIRNHRAEQTAQGGDLQTMHVQHHVLGAGATLSDAKQYTTGISLPAPLVNLPQIITLLGHEQLLQIVTGYYESVPLLTFVKARYAFVNDIGPADTQHWHADPGSFRVLKALIYLNDVDDGGGPFEYIAGSHKRKFPGWDKHMRHDETALRKVYAPEQFITCTARAGDVLFAEVSGFHRGQPPRASDRRILIVNFCVNREYGLPYERIQARRRDVEKTTGLHRALFDDLELTD